MEGVDDVVVFRRVDVFPVGPGFRHIGQIAGGGQPTRRRPLQRRLLVARQEIGHEIDGAVGDCRRRRAAFVLLDRRSLDLTTFRLPHDDLCRAALIAAVADVDQRHVDVADLHDLVEEDVVIAGQLLAVIGEHLLAILLRLGDGQLPTLERYRPLVVIVG